MKYVKVVKCSNPDWWYIHYIGEIFKVKHDNYSGEDYLVREHKYENTGLTIIDCVDSTEEEYNIQQEISNLPKEPENYDYLIEFLTTKGIK